MQMYEEREKAINDAKQLLVELDNIRKTFICHKEKNGKWDTNSLQDLKSEKNRIIGLLEQCRKRANLSHGHFHSAIYRNIDFTKSNPVDENTGKLKTCYIKKNRNVIRETLPVCK